jgi:hypothetical protein
MQRIDGSKAHSRMIAEVHMTSKHLRAKSKGRAKIAGLALAAGSLLSMSGFPASPASAGVNWVHWGGYWTTYGRCAEVGQDVVFSSDVFVDYQCRLRSPGSSLWTLWVTIDLVT